MSDFGMTPQGFIPKRLADIVTSLEGRLSEVYDPTTGEYLSPQDPIVTQLTDILAEGLSECWNAAFDASVQFDPLKSTGACLDGLVQLNGILKFAGTKTQINITVTGTNGTVIPAGSIIATVDGSIQFLIDDSITISGSTAATATCTINGAIAPPNGTIINILSPLSGWSTVANTGIAVLGSEPETELELRQRQQVSTSNTSYRQIEAIYASILNIAGVQYCRVYQNSTLNADSRGIPAKSISAVVYGGDDQDIAEIIFKKSPESVETFGNTLTVCADIQGIAYNIYFQRPEPIDIDVEVITKITDSGLWPTDGPNQIKTAIVDYAEFSVSPNIGFPPGSNALHSRLYTPANSIPGHNVQTIRIAVHSAELLEQDVIIEWGQVARFTTANITVTVI